MKKPVYIYFLILLSFSLIYTLSGQANLYIESISTDRGLSQGTINDILQDREGFLWIATKDGLNRYDGYNFEIFTNDVNDPFSIVENTINLLFEDSEGRIWAASENGGINILDKKTNRFHRISHNPDDPTSLSGNQISYIEEDTSGYFIVGINENEINMFRLDESFFTEGQPPSIIRLPMPIPKKTGGNFEVLLKGIVKDGQGRIWVGSQDGTYHLNVQKAKLTLAVENFAIGTT
jgi:ligand-binding sensor domain-containing protein